MQKKFKYLFICIITLLIITNIYTLSLLKKKSEPIKDLKGTFITANNINGRYLVFDSKNNIVYYYDQNSLAIKGTYKKLEDTIYLLELGNENLNLFLLNNKEIILLEDNTTN